MSLNTGGLKMEKNLPFVITISRQLGSGGSFIGQQLAQKLNAFYADREIIRKAAEQLSVLEEDLESRDEKILSFWESFVYTTVFAPDVYIPSRSLLPTDRELFEAEAEIIKHIARERSAVIIGRCGFHILREFPNRLSLFLHAEHAFRSDRIQKQYAISSDEAETMIVQSDKERALYCKTFTGKNWTDATLYDLSIDTGKIGLDKTAAFILSYPGLI